MAHAFQKTMYTRLLLFLLLATACDADTIDTATLVFDTGDACGQSAPQIDILQVTSYTADEPKLVFAAIASDEDGALHSSIFRVWLDTDVDDQVDTSGEPDVVFELDAVNSLEATPCETPGGFPMTLHWPYHDALPADIQFEVGASIEDADGYISEAVLAGGCTPTDSETTCAI